MRGVARGLVFGLALVAALPIAAFAASAPPYFRAIRELDGAQFLEDEPIWMCNPEASGAETDEIPVRLVGREDGGRVVVWGPAQFGPGQGSRSELAAWFVPDRRLEFHPPGPFGIGGLRAGRYQIQPVGRDSARVLATFRVIEPRGSELAVRAALARAARLNRGEWLDRGNIQALRMFPTPWQVQAATLYEAVLERYPRTAYRSLIYSGLWRVRSLTSFGADGRLWIEEVFAHFHNTCFGEWALHLYVMETRKDEARVELRRLVGLYPDTRMSRAAARYL